MEQKSKTFPLSVGSETYTYTYKDSHGDYNLIEIAGDKIRIKEADCDDQICVEKRMGIKKWGDNRMFTA